MPRPPKGYMYPQRYNDNRLSLGDLFSSSSRIDVNQDALKTDASGNLINPNAPVFSGQRRKFLGFIPYGENPAETANAELAAEDRLQLRSLANQKALAALLSGHRMDENNASSRNKISEYDAQIKTNNTSEREMLPFRNQQALLFNKQQGKQQGRQQAKNDRRTSNNKVREARLMLPVTEQNNLNTVLNAQGVKGSPENIAATTAAFLAKQNNALQNERQTGDINQATFGGRKDAATFAAQQAALANQRAVNEAMTARDYSSTDEAKQAQQLGQLAGYAQPFATIINASPILPPNSVQRNPLAHLIGPLKNGYQFPDTQYGQNQTETPVMKRTKAGNVETEEPALVVKNYGPPPGTPVGQVSSNTVAQARAIVGGGTNNPPSTVVPAPAPAAVRAPIAPQVDALVSPSAGQPEPLNTDANSSAQLPKTAADELSMQDMIMNRIVKGTDIRPQINQRARALAKEIGIVTPKEYFRSKIGEDVPLSTQEIGENLRKSLSESMFGKENWLSKQKEKPLQSAIGALKRKREEQHLNALREMVSQYYE